MQDNNTSTNKRIAKNTIMLYIRMMLSMVISLYTSRVVLQTLGVVDYGIYGVIGGVLAMFTFINSSMAGATSRFLTYELGKGDNKKLRDIFSSAFCVHVIIALLILILCETIGVWFINSKLVIPANRLYAAHWVFQLSILTMVVSVTQVPYNASIFSHERMDVYAYVEIANALLRLLVVYILMIGHFDKLILFATLNLLLSFIIAVVYRYFCVKKFNECRLRTNFDKSLIIPMLSFSGWDLFGNMSVMVRSQGVNMLLNIFFGPIMNAALEIANKVQSVTMNLSSNVSTAMRPQIVKHYAVNEYEKMLSLTRNGSRLTFILMMFFTIPIIAEVRYILKLWLGVVPEHTDLICVLTLLWNLCVCLGITNSYAVDATGKVKKFSFVAGIIYLMTIPISYIAYFFHYPYWIPFVYNVLANLVTPFISGSTLKKEIIGYSYKKVLIPDMIRAICAAFVALVITCSLHLFLPESLLRFFLTVALSFSITLLLSYFIILPKNVSEKIWKYIINKCIKNNTWWKNLE